MKQADKCPRCDRPFDNAFPKGIRVTVGWIVAWVCFACVSEFMRGKGD